MSRFQFPTPSMSGEFHIKDQPDVTDLFALPPAALSPQKAESVSRRSSRSDPTFVPASPTSPALTAHGRTAAPSRSGKRSLEDFELPPPPTRTRKIIQMKPKSPAGPKPSTKSKENGKVPQASPDAPPSKRKQPSATSAAGRKIARKTAHSLIERRRRSKMNEEFGTLKDMIPACQGQEMHKLAILQASIDYVNYLERCISDLKTAGSHSLPPSPTSPQYQPPQRPPSTVYSYSDSASASASPEILPPSAQMSDTSPAFSPRTRGPSIHTLPDLTSILPSPALGPTHTNPSMDKTQDPQGIDQEASAALLMLTQDRRGTADSITEHLSQSTALARPAEESKPHGEGRRKGMSVRDLLIS